MRVPDDLRVLTPTATMAQHLQNRMAREGVLLRGSMVQTLSGFIQPWTADLPQIPEATFYLVVEGAAHRVNRPEFARVAELPGFCASLARTISEFSSAGCDSARLAEHLPDAPLAAAFAAVYREVDRELERRGMAMRAKRLERAAERIERDGLPGIRTIRLEGFHAMPDPELRLIDALSRHVEVRTEPRAAGKRPSMFLFSAPSVEREVEEIASRILAQAAAGRPFREMGIVVRAADAYVPLLRSTLERFGIPARYYFDSPLDRHAAVRFLCGAVEAMLGGWDHAQTLAALRLAPRFADSMVMDRFDFAVREQIPNAGLGPLKALLVTPDGHAISSGAERLVRKIDRMAAIEEWRSFALSPKDWAAQLGELRGLFRPARPPEGIGHEAALELRSQAAALKAFDEALDEAAAALDAARQMSLEQFWRALKSVLRLKPLRLDDGRRNVVHVLSAPEARQWELPVVFLCGMTEKQFPQLHRQDPFFPDAARCRLRAAGIRVRTAAEFDREERELFDAAITGASEAVTLSYPEFDSRGERNLPSMFLEGLDAPLESNHRYATVPSRTQGAPGEEAVSCTAVRAPKLLGFLREKTAKLSPTALETYLQCPFQYFAQRTLRLAGPPARPEERLDFMMQGNIVHETLAEWYAQPGADIGPLFERIFERALEENRIPPGYHAERLRNAMLEDLRGFAADGRWPRAAFQSSMEQSFAFPLDDSVRISGKIDRVDVDSGGRAYIIDYKYSAAQRTRQRLADENLLQAPLYLMAAEKAFGLKPAGMFYVGLKGGVVYAGWSDGPVAGLTPEPVPPQWLERAAERTLGAVEEIRAGRAEPAPANPGLCRFCDFRDVCRVGEAESRPAPAAEGA